MKTMRALSAVPVAVPFSHESWLLQRLGQAAARGDICPSAETLAGERGISRAALEGCFRRLEERGAIRSVIEHRRRVVTIVATGVQTAARQLVAATAPPKVLPPEIHCPFCGGLFRPRDKRHTYCTKTCGQKAWHEHNAHVPASGDEPESEFPPHSPQGRNESGVRPAPTIFEMPRDWRTYRYEDHPEAARLYNERKARGYQPKIYPHYSIVSGGDSVLGDF